MVLGHNSESAGELLGIARKECGRARPQQAPSSKRYFEFQRRGGFHVAAPGTGAPDNSAPHQILGQCPDAPLVKGPSDKFLDINLKRRLELRLNGHSMETTSLRHCSLVLALVLSSVGAFSAYACTKTPDKACDGKQHNWDCTGAQTKCCLWCDPSTGSATEDCCDPYANCDPKSGCGSQS